MSSEIIDLTLPAHDPSISKPRGLLPVPQEIEDRVAREEARIARENGIGHLLGNHAWERKVIWAFPPVWAGFAPKARNSDWVGRAEAAEAAEADSNHRACWDFA
jgi:hypothetical protein